MTSSLLSYLVPLPQLCYWIINEKIVQNVDTWDAYFEWLSGCKQVLCVELEEQGNRISLPVLKVLLRTQL